mgnify:CR=1 FL=1
MNALDKLQEKQERGEPLTSLEFAVWWCTDRICAKKAANDLFTFQARIAYLEAQERDHAALRARVEKLEETGNKLVSLALSFNEDDPWIFERYDGVEIVSNAQNTLRGEA